MPRSIKEELAIMLFPPSLGHYYTHLTASFPGQPW